MLKIVIVDDHPVIRRGLKQIITEEPNIEVIGEAENAQVALTLIRETDCDAVILDITMPGTSGLDVLKQVKCEYPKLPVLILSVHPEEQYAVRVIRAGASGYMTKDNTPDELIKAIRKIASGGKYITPFLAEKLVSVLDASQKLLHERLSDREFQVMRMIASGKAISDIAEELCLSGKTVSTYRARILKKMNMKSNAELIRYALENELV